MTEISPAALRGKMICMYEIFVSVGVLASFMAGYILVDVDMSRAGAGADWGWRYAYAVPGTCVCVCVCRGGRVMYGRYTGNI